MGDNEEQKEMAETTTTTDTSTNKIVRRKRHGARNQHKIKFFLRWLAETFPTAMASTVIRQDDESIPPTTKEGDSEFFAHPLILDIASGKGELAARLCFCNRQRVILVDPRPADVEHCYTDVVLRGLPKKWQQRFREKEASNPCVLAQALRARVRQLTMYFDTDAVEQNAVLRTSVQHAALLIGMHADGATEAIVDVALEYGKPFVVVPCCVFPSFFPNRKVVKDNGSLHQVRSYEDFCQYLAQKDPRLRTSELPFEGRNVAIWWDGT